MRNRWGLKQWFERSLVVAGVLVLAGCSGYWRDRWNDAKDPFTLTVEESVGVKAGVGPVRLALFRSTSAFGFRGGAPTWAGDEPVVYHRGQRMHDAWIGPFGTDEWEPTDAEALARGKFWRADQASLWWFPAVDVAPARRSPSYVPWFTDIEAAVGLGVGLRVGLNPGELLDFVLGFVGLDMFDDDIWADDPVLVRIVGADDPSVDWVEVRLSGWFGTPTGDGRLAFKRPKVWPADLRVRARFFDPAREASEGWGQFSLDRDVAELELEFGGSGSEPFELRVVSRQR